MSRTFKISGTLIVTSSGIVGITGTVCVVLSIGKPMDTLYTGSASGSVSHKYGSGSFHHLAKKKKNLDFYCFLTSL